MVRFHTTVSVCGVFCRTVRTQFTSVTPCNTQHGLLVTTVVWYQCEHQRMHGTFLSTLLCAHKSICIRCELAYQTDPAHGGHMQHSLLILQAVIWHIIRADMLRCFAHTSTCVNLNAGPAGTVLQYKAWHDQSKGAWSRSSSAQRHSADAVWISCRLSDAYMRHWLSGAVWFVLTNCQYLSCSKSALFHAAHS